MLDTEGAEDRRVHVVARARARNAGHARDIGCHERGLLPNFSGFRPRGTAQAVLALINRNTLQYACLQKLPDAWRFEHQGFHRIFQSHEAPRPNNGHSEGRGKGDFLIGRQLPRGRRIPERVRG